VECRIVRTSCFVSGLEVFPGLLKLAICPAKSSVVCPSSGAVGSGQGGIFDAVNEAMNKANGQSCGWSRRVWIGSIQGYRGVICVDLV
jgi:hypothetical protein